MATERLVSWPKALAAVVVLLVMSEGPDYLSVRSAARVRPVPFQSLTAGILRHSVNWHMAFSRRAGVVLKER